ncbi:unnamed protein product [Darwinula stevensoni]|uniref:PPM-type phosphatase domain-containing protein n=1 Tax=Darwinula stevensoni TaxID=69355 RepID=A0A7R8X729_9CRUS|nr:unnamed protein product [Darwinula stevensoni]CAG0886424.1 unnamed protein product [Darwinula stevensoni]
MLMEKRRAQPEIVFSRNYEELPAWLLGGLDEVVFAASTGPDGGLTAIKHRPMHLTTNEPDVEFIDEDEDHSQQSPCRRASLSTKSSPEASEVEASSCLNEISEWNNNHENPSESAPELTAGIQGWNRPHPFAYGVSTTLYEKNPVTRINAGNPIADSYAIVARKNNAIMALADGVNWGEKPSLAAKCAVHGCIDYLNKALFPLRGAPLTTKDIFLALMRSMCAAHQLILLEEGDVTTLTVAVIVPMILPNKYAVCICNVGDSLAYVYNRQTGVREITYGSHDINSMRNMRDALGALGPVDGISAPVLNNLTCSMTQVEPGDIVFLTSDGVSDNCDPVVGKFALPKEVKKKSGTRSKRKDIHPHAPQEDSLLHHAGLPVVEAFQRHELTMMRMDDLVSHGVGSQNHRLDSGRDITPQDLCHQLIDFATRLTNAKRRILEDPELYEEEGAEREGPAEHHLEDRSRRKRVSDRLAQLPGKLDHATVVAYRVGVYHSDMEEEEEDFNAPLESPV